MTYSVRYESDVITTALAAADARLLAAKNRHRLRKGLPPLHAPDQPAVCDGLPRQALPEWGLRPQPARLYAILVAMCPLSFADIGRELYGEIWLQRDQALRAHISTLRTTLRPHGIVIPQMMKARIQRPYLRGAQ